MKLMLQDQLGLSPVLQHSPMDAQNVERIETLLLPILAAHPAGYSNWLLPATFTFVPQCKPKIKLAFVLCSTRAESPVRTLPIELIKRILRFAAGHLRFDGERNVVAPTTKCSSNRDSSRYGFLSPVSKRIARNHRHISLLPYRKVRLPKLLRPVLPCQDR